jgi:hypothetical protein
MLGPLKVLRVLPRGTAKVQDYGALLGNRVNRFHGWQPNVDIGALFVDPDDKQQKRNLVHVKRVGVEHAIEISMSNPHVGEYIRHLRDGDLWPADQATATAIGLKFDPDFGDEHDEDAKAQLADDLAALHELHGCTKPLAAVLEDHGVSVHSPKVSQ